jgi:cell division protein FtsQ
MKLAEENLPRMDNQGPDDEPRYLRRPKAVAIRRGRLSRRIRRAAIAGIIVTLILVPGGYAGYRLMRAALTSPLFDLKSPDDVKILGNYNVSRAEVLSAMEFPSSGAFEHGVNLFKLSLDTKRDELETIPWIRSATLVRAFPGRLAVYITERTPVAFAELDGRVKLVDEDGVLLDKPEKAPYDFPVIEGLTDDQTPAERKERLQIYLQFTHDTSDEFTRSGWSVSQVDLTDAADVKALLVEGHRTMLVHFGHERFLDRLQNFVTLLPELDKQNARIDSVDLRYRDEVVVNPGESNAQNDNSPGNATRVGPKKD